MKTKTILETLAIFSLLAAVASAQVTVTTVTTNALGEPYNVVLDANNNIYVSDSVNNRIVRIDANTQAQSTLAGSGIPGVPGQGTNDGPAYLALFNSPQGLLSASIGGTNGLIVTDSGNNSIRFVRLSDGFVITLAGQAGVAGPAVDAVGASATFSNPLGLDMDGTGNIYIADSGNSAIRVINLNDPAFGVTNVAISGTTLYRPSAIAIAGASQFWVADTGNQSVKLIALTTPTTGSLTTYMGSNDRRTTGTTDSTFGPNARFNGPRGLLAVGNVLLIADTANNTIRLATNNANFGATNFSVSTYAGTPGQSGLVDGAANSAKFNWPIGLTRDVAGNGFLVADLANNVLRRIQTGPPLPPVSAPQIGWVDFTVPPAIVVSVLRPGSSFVFNNDQIIAIISEPGTETFFTFGPTPANPLDDTIPIPNRGTGSTPPPYHDGMTPDQVPPSMVQPQPDLTIKAISVQDGRQNSPVIQTRIQYKTANPNIQGDNAASFIVKDETHGASMWYTINGTDPTEGAPSLGPITDGTTLSLNVSSNLTFKIRAFRDHYTDSEIVTKVFSLTNFTPNRISFGFEGGEASSDFIASPGQTFYAPVTLSILTGQRIYSLQFNITVSNLNSVHSVFPGAVGFQSFLEKPNPVPPAFITIPPAMFLGTATNLVITQVTNEVTVIDLFQVITNSIVPDLFSTSGYTAEITNGNRLITNYVEMTGSIGRVRTVTNLVNVSTYTTNIDAGFKVDTSFITLDSRTVVLSVPAVVTNVLIVPAFMDPPPTSLIWYPFDLTSPFLDLEFVNSTLNLVGVGWLERAGAKNLYDTTKQDLIKYSQPHDTLFDENDGRVVLGGYAFWVPPSATPGETYQIRIGRPSATSDGVGAPGSDVFIDTPTNGSFTAGALNAVKTVTAGQRRYIAGDVAPFRWFNAGDFGNSNLLNDDVMQVFEAAVYELDYPPFAIFHNVLFSSDFFDGMDSCCGFYVDNGKGYLEKNGIRPDDASRNPLFDGDDTMINQFAFGDGFPPDVTDVYVTYRRSLDPSLQWFQRFWTNGVLGAQLVPNTFHGNALPNPQLPANPKVKPAVAGPAPAVAFAAGDAQGSAGQVLQIPITANISGTYPLRVLMLNLTVEPLDGSPALTVPVQFTPNPALGQPTLTSAKGNGNYAGTWLDSKIAGLTGTATLGTLTVTIPANAPSSAAYAIHFDHASASPNGIASFPKQTRTGLITLSDRSGSSFNDGIPDSWRLRYFGTVNNVLSQAGADADGNGMNNWQKYIAGLDPLDPNSVLKVSADQPAAQPSDDCVIHWPSVAGKQYVIERSSTLFEPVWIPVSTNAGSGTDMELHDTAGGSIRFYRVRVLP